MVERLNIYDHNIYSKDFNRKRSHESFTPILNDKISEQIINSLSLNV